MLFAQNKIIVIDNGMGMTRQTIEDNWMQIGTNDKEINIYSPKGRIKTGAKGIGRFALDKLSLSSQVYSKNRNDRLISWSIDWEQFSNTMLLNQIYADLEYTESNFQTAVRKILTDNCEFLDRYTFDTGTAIILNPTREMWSERLFKKVNNNLQSIIPLNSKDKFNIIISNQGFSEYDFNSEKMDKKIVNFDYKIEGMFNVNNILEFTVYRNEIDIEKASIEYILNDKSYSFDLNEFWGREAFNKDGYRRDDYNKSIKFSIDLNEVLKDDVEYFSKLGRFSFCLYFLKAGKSDLEIIKNFNLTKRREFNKNFYGIKLYRDEFKVRPYGDEGSLFDWLGLGVRAQKSPAAVTHVKGNWRVEPYQMIGSVSIGRIQNPTLTDMANREGLAPNYEYSLLISIMETVFKNFEFDRQYVLREYFEWRKQKIKDLEPTSKVIDTAIKKSSRESDRNIDAEGEAEYEEEFSNNEYEDAIRLLVQEKNDEQKTRQILMAFSSAGVIANTFSHEISRISTDVGSRMQHLRESIRRILNYEDYNGDEDFNPFGLIHQSEETDALLNSWIRIIMNAITSRSFDVNELDINKMISDILGNWIPMMNKKYITINTTFNKELIKLVFSEIDLHLILNNFLLNSAWFLEESVFSERIINITFNDNQENSVLIMDNNGPCLSKIYSNNPDIIFNAGETSKNNGTGLGLWIMKEVVHRYSGEIGVIDMENGFGIKIVIPK